MRIHGSRIAIALVACAVAAAPAWAQREGRERHRDERFGNPHWVYDSRHHLNHYYPVRGEVVAAVPAGAISIRFGDGRFFFHGGVWFRASGPRFVVVAPPLGVVVPVLPPAYVTLWFGGVPYYYANDVYYTQVPDGYVVVAPPPGLESTPPPPPAPSPPEPVIYPRNGQSPQQTDADRSACAQWATQQATGKDASVFQRAFAACMDGRGYTVR
ncbi:MAG: DUF6515 family protein [Gemmatimonadota bacterium]